MKQLFMHMERALLEGEALVLATVISSTGATPRGAGARMLLGPQGRLWGSVGGGPIEYRAQQLAMELPEAGQNMTQSFSLTQDDILKLGMICGGTAKIHFHLLTPKTVSPELPRQALNCLSQGTEFWLVEDLSPTGSLTLYTKDTAPSWLPLDTQPQLFCLDGKSFFLTQIETGSRLFLFGGGHVAQELEPIVTHLGFRCQVVDDRPEFANRDCFPSADRIFCTEFDNLQDKLSIGPRDFVCIMTRGHAHDTAIAAQVLRHHPRYIGMIGSRKKHTAVCQTLRETYGYRDEEIAKIVSPIGLAIGAQTPAEIAISIAAQLIAARAGSRHNDFFKL